MPFPTDENLDDDDETEDDDIQADMIADQIAEHGEDPYRYSAFPDPSTEPDEELDEGPVRD